MFNTKTYDMTNNNYNANFDTYIIGNNNVPVDGIKYYSNKFGQVMTSFIVDSGDTILGGNLIVTESTTIHGKSNFKNDVTITGNVYIPGNLITPFLKLLFPCIVVDSVTNKFPPKIVSPESTIKLVIT